MTNTTEKTWVSLTQAAAQLGISRHTLNELLAEHQDIEVFRLKRNIRIERTELARLRGRLTGPRP